MNKQESIIDNLINDLQRRVDGEVKLFNLRINTNGEPADELINKINNTTEIEVSGKFEQGCHIDIKTNRLLTEPYEDILTDVIAEIPFIQFSTVYLMTSVLGYVNENLPNITIKPKNEFEINIDKFWDDAITVIDNNDESELTVKTRNCKVGHSGIAKIMSFIDVKLDELLEFERECL